MKKTQGTTIFTIDLGTSGPKVGLYSTGGDLIDHEFEPVALFLTQDGGAEQDPEEWWSAIRAASLRLSERNAGAMAAVAAISCTGQWTGTVAVDRNGRPLMNAVIWMDTRGEPYAKEIVKGIINVDGYGVRKLSRWIRLTGAAPSPTGKDSCAHILYIKNARPDVYERTFKFLEPKDYLNLRLTGRFAASHDSITMHWVTDNRDPAHCKYDDRLIEYSQFDRSKLPELKSALDILGPVSREAARELGVSAEAEVVMGTPDFHAAALGSSAVADYSGHLYLGTSSWIGYNMPRKVTSVVHQIGSIPSPVPGHFAIADEQESAGACLKFLRDSLFFANDELSAVPAPEAVFTAFDRLAAASPPGSRGVMFTPWLVGERTPVADPTVRAGLTNLTLSTSRSDLVRAVLEGVAFNSKWLLQNVEKLARKRIGELYVVGGGAVSDLWCQIYSDILDRRISRLENPIMATSTGAAYLAAVALGTLSFDEIHHHPKVSRRFEPIPANRLTYDRIYSEFVQFYKNNRRSYARLNSVQERMRAAVS